MNNIEQTKLNEILIAIQNELVELKRTTRDIESRLQNIETSTQNMDTHIGFVESIYDTLKYPICHVLDYYYGTDTQTSKRMLQIKRDDTNASNTNDVD